jgi:hypothetical protein
MAFGGTVAIRAMKDADFVATIFPGTTAGLQAAIDYLGGGKGKVSIGPGTLEITVAVSVHGACHIQGSGVNATIIKRATGSLTSGDAAHSGNCFLSTPYGSNGTITTAGTAIADVTISDMTIDGNQANFGAVNPATPNHMAIRLDFTDGVRLFNLRIQEFLQSGIQMNECRNTFSDDLYLYTVGQYASATSRNGLDFLNNAASAAGYSNTHQVHNLTCDVVTDAPLHIKNNANVVVRNLIVKGGSKYVVELEAAAVGTSATSDVLISGVSAEAVSFHFIAAIPNPSCFFENIIVENFTCDFADSHAQNALALCRDNDSYFRGFKLRGGVLRNINKADTNNLSWVEFSSTSATESRNLTIQDVTFEGGVPSSTNTGIHGITLEGNLGEFDVSACVVRDCPGVGINVRPVGGVTIQRGTIRGNKILNCGNDGIHVIPNSGTGNTVKDIIVEGNIIIDSCETSGSNGILVGTDVASNTGSDLVVCNNRTNKVSAAGMITGIRINGTGTTDEVHVHGNHTQGLTNDYVVGGSPTNLHVRYPAGRGTDIAAAATIAIPRDGEVFHVTGNTNITNGITVSLLDNGRTVVLIFDGTPTVSDTGTSRLSAAFVATADDTLTLCCDGTNWYEVARSAN